MSQRRSEDQGKSLRCPICFREFTTLMSLRIHARIVHKTHGECPACGKVFRDLTKHYRCEALKSNDLMHKVMYVLNTGKLSNVPDTWIDETVEYLSVKD